MFYFVKVLYCLIFTNCDLNLVNNSLYGENNITTINNDYQLNITISNNTLNGFNQNDSLFLDKEPGNSLNGSKADLISKSQQIISKLITNEAVDYDQDNLNITNNISNIIRESKSSSIDSLFIQLENDLDNNKRSDQGDYLPFNETMGKVLNESNDYSDNSLEYNVDNHNTNIVTMLFNELKATDNESTSMTADEKFIALFNKIKKLYNIVVKELTPIMIEQILTANISLNCMIGLAKVYEAVNNNEQWVFKMLDSNGHIPSGIMSGTLTSLGDYDQCLAVSSDDHNIKGQYCLIKIKTDLPEKKKVITFDETLIDLNGTQWQNTWIESFLAKSLYNFYYYSIINGVCIPSTCTHQDINALVKEFLSPFHLIVNVEDCQTMTKTPLILNRGQTIALLIIIAFVSVNIFATVLDKLFVRDDIKYHNSFVVIIKCFSMQRNIEKFFSDSSNNQKTHKISLTFINGLRVMSIIWIIIGHTYISGAIYFNKDIPTANFYFDNLVDTINLPRQLFTQFIINALLGVDTFFFISGLLVVYLSVNKCRDNNLNLNFCNYIILRWTRFAPLLTAMIAFNILWPLLGSGPLFNPSYIDKITGPCYDYWWRNLLFISNWYNPGDQCMIHTWYMSADFQFYVIAFFIIKLTRTNINKGIISTLLLTLMGVIVPTLIAYINSLPPTILYQADIEKMSNDISLMHYLSYNHITPYFMGSLVGCLLLKSKEINITQPIKGFLWLTTCFGLLFVIFITYVWTSLEWKYTRVGASVYFGLHRLIWASGLAWIAYNCARNKAGIVNTILSSKVFRLTSRLTFSIYMSHMIIIWFNFFRTQHLFSSTHYDMLFTAAGVYGFTLVFAFINHIVFEAPVDSLVKSIMNNIKIKDLNSNEINFNNNIKHLKSIP